MALFPAVETTRPEGERLFSDPFARGYLPCSLRVVADLSSVGTIHRSVCRLIDRRWPGARSSGIARTKLIDDTVGTALEAGVRQVVILGAGFDSRAYRMPQMSNAAVYEVDQPLTSERKVSLTRRQLGSLPGNVKFVQMDFNRQTLDSVLKDAGYRKVLATVFIWEGVTNYLTVEAVGSTLDFCGMAAPGSTLIFTYIDQAVLDDSQAFEGSEKIRKVLARAGERWTFGMVPGQVSQYLDLYGLRLEGDVGAVEYRRRYFGTDRGAMRGYEFYRVAVAVVPERGAP